jgi:hypothetical protein
MSCNQQQQAKARHHDQQAAAAPTIIAQIGMTEMGITEYRTQK